MPFVNVTCNLSRLSMDCQLKIKTLISHDVLPLLMEALEAVVHLYQAVSHGLTHKSLFAALAELYPSVHVSYSRTFYSQMYLKNSSNIFYVTFGNKLKKYFTKRGVSIYCV